MKKTKLGINGFGRIGRQVLRHALTDYSETLEVVAVSYTHLTLPTKA